MRYYQKFIPQHQRLKSFSHNVICANVYFLYLSYSPQALLKAFLFPVIFFLYVMTQMSLNLVWYSFCSVQCILVMFLLLGFWLTPNILKRYDCVHFPFSMLFFTVPTSFNCPHFWSQMYVGPSFALFLFIKFDGYETYFQNIQKRADVESWPRSTLPS